MKIATPGSPSSKAMREVAETFDRIVSHEALGSTYGIVTGGTSTL